MISTRLRQILVAFGKSISNNGNAFLKTGLLMFDMQRIKALKIHSVIYWSVSINGHHICSRGMSQMYKIALSFTLAGQIWPYLLFLSTHTPLPVFAAIFDFWNKLLIYGCFDINFSLYTHFYVRKVKCNHIDLFVSTFFTKLLVLGFQRLKHLYCLSDWSSLTLRLSVLIFLSCHLMKLLLEAF